MTPAYLDRLARIVAAGAPPLTDEQITEVRALLHDTPATVAAKARLSASRPAPTRRAA